LQDYSQQWPQAASSASQAALSTPASRAGAAPHPSAFTRPVTRHGFYTSLVVAGTVESVDYEALSFVVRTLSRDEFKAMVGPTTNYSVLTNLDRLPRDHVDPPEDVPEDAGDVEYNLRKYIVRGRPLFVGGVLQQDGDRERFEARTVYLLHSDPGLYLFEETHWWLVQVTQMADRILDHLFDARRSYTIDDFAKFYRTSLNVLGQATDDSVQECAVLSRLIYDLSSAYMLTGADRYFLAARAAVNYMREAFRSLSHDGRYCFWVYGRSRSTEGEKGEALIMASRGPDDQGTIPLYEQIYALAGLAQYHRITLDWEVFRDIRRTINTFQGYFWDRAADDPRPEQVQRNPPFAGTGGYYSHLDPTTMRPDTASLGENCSRKNWNSIGDHIPAYLVNVILALDPPPRGAAGNAAREVLSTCDGILEEVSTLIMERFPDPDEDVPFVNERFHADWTPDKTYRWQLNRAVVGHNLKIAWNLTRCAFRFQTRAKQLRDDGDRAAAAEYDERAERCLRVATRLGDDMAQVGIDRIRGGVFDLVEREPQSGMPVQFSWAPTKDFWQQEQGILAYLILHGAAASDTDYLELARACSAFWNVFFLDREREGYFFRTTENGLPVLEGQYGMKSSHAIGYHAFELSYLADLYTRVFVAAGGGSDNSFCLYFKIRSPKQPGSINVLPDFMPPGRVRVTRVHANGVDVTDDLEKANLAQFQVETSEMTPDPVNGTVELVVEFAALPVDA
jgi:mannose/cellobiose epimerase-like protein (N-acyl-D-glucosamine 2-epimerase family)